MTAQPTTTTTIRAAQYYMLLDLLTRAVLERTLPERSVATLRSLVRLGYAEPAEGSLRWQISAEGRALIEGKLARFIDNNRRVELAPADPLVGLQITAINAAIGAGQPLAVPVAWITPGRDGRLFIERLSLNGSTRVFEDVTRLYPAGELTLSAAQIAALHAMLDR